MLLRLQMSQGNLLSLSLSRYLLSLSRVKTTCHESKQIAGPVISFTPTCHGVDKVGQELGEAVKVTPLDDLEELHGDLTTRIMQGRTL